MMSPPAFFQLDTLRSFDPYPSNNLKVILDLRHFEYC